MHSKYHFFFGAGSPRRSLLARSALCSSLLSSARSSLDCRSLLLGRWGQVLLSASWFRSPSRWCCRLPRSRSGSSPRCRSPICLFGCLARRWRCWTSFQPRLVWPSPRVSSPDLVPFGALDGLVPGPLIACGFSFPGVWLVQLPGWLPSGLAEGLLRESPCPFGLGW